MGGEFVGDKITGTEGNDYWGTNYKAGGGNFGIGKAWYGYISFTFRFYPVDSNYWICDGLKKLDRNLITLKFLSHEKVKKNIYS